MSEINELKKQLAELSDIVHRQSMQYEDLLAIFRKYVDSLEKLQIQIEALRQ